ncbi:MAG: 2'-5' RNA ligase family protein [Acidiferrobacterales bacterium]
MMTEVTRYSLWLLPDEAATESFTGVIDRFSDRYRGPRFTPHVTLLGWVTGVEQNLRETTVALAEELPAPRLQPAGLGGEAYYFRCFYVKLQKSTELLQIHERASAAFKAGYASDYLPHLSLVYGHLPPARKAALDAEMENTLPVEFIADRLQLVHITVSVADWRVVTTCSLRAERQ